MCVKWAERPRWQPPSSAGKLPARSSQPYASMPRCGCSWIWMKWIYQYSNVVIAVSRDFYRRSPETVEALVRAYTEGVAAAHDQKETALKVIAKYTRLKDPRLIEELYKDADKFLDRVPRVEPEAIAPIVEFMGKKPILLETIADNSVIDR